MFMAGRNWATYMSSRGEMKISLKLMIWVGSEFCFEASQQNCPHFRVEGASRASVLGMSAWTELGC